MKNHEGARAGRECERELREPRRKRLGRRLGSRRRFGSRFRRADLQMYEAVKTLVRRCGGDVLPLTANFRTVPSVIEFVNDRFREVFVQPGDPDPIALQPYRDEVDAKAARTVALTAAVAQTIAAFIDDITREKPWAVYDPDLKRTRPARPGDIAILVRKMTPDFVAPF